MCGGGGKEEGTDGKRARRGSLADGEGSETRAREGSGYIPASRVFAYSSPLRLSIPLRARASATRPYPCQQSSVGAAVVGARLPFSRGVVGARDTMAAAAMAR